MSSDGLTYSSSADLITTASSGAGGLANNSAWFRMQDPSGTREFTCQRGTSNTVWRVKYSYASKFTTGSPGITQTPLAADQGIAFGAGTDASPTYSSWFTTDGTYRLQIMADNATRYGFYLVTYAIGGGTNSMAALVFDPLIDTASGDVDASMIYPAIPGNTTFSSSHLGGANPLGWLGGSFVTIPGQTIGPFPGGLPSNPHNGKDDSHPVPYARPISGNVSPQGWKGYSTLIRWRGTLRSTPSTATVSTSKDRLIVNSCSLDWDGTTDPVL
jgi:hypothetical protein